MRRLRRLGLASSVIALATLLSSCSVAAPAREAVAAGFDQGKKNVKEYLSSPEGQADAQALADAAAQKTLDALRKVFGAWMADGKDAAVQAAKDAAIGAVKDLGQGIEAVAQKHAETYIDGKMMDLKKKVDDGTADTKEKLMYYLGTFIVGGGLAALLHKLGINTGTNMANASAPKNPAP